MAKNGVKITELLRDYMWNVCTRHHDYRDMKDFEAFILEIRGLEYKINDADKENKQLRHRLCEQSLEINKLHEEIKGLEDKLTMKEEDNTRFRVFDPISVRTFMCDEATIKDVVDSVNEMYHEIPAVDICDATKNVLNKLGLVK